MEGQDRAHYYKITTNDELGETSFQLLKTTDKLEPEDQPQAKEQLKQENDYFLAKAGEDIVLD